MKIRLLAGISMSLLIARWRQTMVAAIGVTFSITMFIALLCFMSGLNGMLDGLIINRTPHVRIYKEIKASDKQPVEASEKYAGVSHHFIHSVKPRNERLEISNSGAIIHALLKHKEVEGIAPKISAQVFYNAGNIALTGMINGIDPVQENRLLRFSDYVTKGNYIDLKNIPNSIVLGKGAADKMLADIGDVILVTTSNGEQMPLKVVGYFQSGLADIDKVQSYTSLETARKLLGVHTGFMTDIQIKLHHMELAPQLAAEWHRLYGTEALDIQKANAQFSTGTAVRNLISYAVGITLLIVAGFGIYNILNMMIYEKMDSIAILKATGFSGNDVNLIFLGIALSIGLVGGSVGLLLGYVTSLLIDMIPFKTEALPMMKTYPVDYNPVFYVIGIVFSLVTTWFAGYFPARKASRIDPVIIIRGK